jgi:flavin reductase (DIM6/NTAB) family NADH-FMN oxidoreductase RutF
MTTSRGTVLPDVDPAQFRQLLGHFATGVTIVTVTAPDGRPLGMTANSLASVSLQPPLVLVCVDRTTEMHPVLLAAERWAVNILRDDQEALSRRFAAPDDNRFDGVGYTVTPDGAVVLDGTIAHIECEPEAHHDAGDHTIFVGRVVGGATRPGRPLLYYRGGYGAPA